MFVSGNPGPQQHRELALLAEIHEVVFSPHHVSIQIVLPCKLCRAILALVFPKTEVLTRLVAFKSFPGGVRLFALITRNSNILLRGVDF